MKTVTFTNGSNDFSLELLESIDEITTDYLRIMGTQLVVAPYHSLVALICRDEANIAINSKKNQSAVSGVIPVFVKTTIDNTSTNPEFTENIECGSKLIISGSAISLGHHVTIKDNPYSLNRIITAIKLDKNSFSKAMEIGTIYSVEFKIIPNSEIKGYYK